MWSPTLQALAPNALPQLRARHPPAWATSQLRARHPPAWATSQLRARHPPAWATSQLRARHPPAWATSQLRARHPPAWATSATQGETPAGMGDIATQARHPPAWATSQLRARHPPAWATSQLRARHPPAWATSQLRARHPPAWATSQLRGPVAALGQTLGRNPRRRRPLKWWHAAGALALVLVNSCGSWARDSADVASETSTTGAAERTGAVLSARDPPAESTAGGDAAVAGSGENDWAPNATVERVVDGDTISVMIGDRLESVRLIGIDTPESVAPTRPVQCFGREASLHLEAMLPAGTEITLVRDVEARDVYDRLLGYVVRSRDGCS